MSAHRSANATVAAHDAAVITPSDSTVFPVTRGLYVGTTGNIRVRMGSSGNVITFPNVPVGIFPVQVDQVYSTSTTASNLIALY